MPKKNKKDKGRRGVVYSTNPDYDYEYENNDNEDTLPPNEQTLYVLLDKKQRGGKQVTLVENFIGSLEDMKTLGKQLKTHCGTGGNVKDGEILIQGDQRNKVVAFLEKEGYNVKRKGG